LNKKLLHLAVLIGLAGAAPAQETAADFDSEIRKDFAAAEEHLKLAEKEKDVAKREPHLEAFRNALQRIIEKYRGVAPTMKEGLFDLGRAYLLAGDPTHAVDKLLRHTEELPDSSRAEEAALFLGDAYMGLGEYAKAVSVYEDFIARREKSARVSSAHYGLGMARFMSAEFSAAIEKFAEIRSTYPSDPIASDATFQLLRTLIAAERIDDARTLSDELLSKFPEAPELKDIRARLDLLGKPAPEIVGSCRWLDAAERTIATLRGKPVVLVFFADFYEPCKVELKNLEGMRQKYGTGEFEFIGLTTWYRKKTKTPEEEMALVKSFLGGLGVTFPVGFAPDFETLKAYHVRGVPEVVVIDREGIIRHIKVGAAKTAHLDEKLLKASLDRLLPR
jgi:TolA-binding protein/peroxiredoxin